MPDDNSDNLGQAAQAVKAICEAVPVYQDGLQPAVREVGKGLETIGQVVNVALEPLRALVWGYDKIKEFIVQKVSEKLQDIPPEDIISPPLHVAGPTVEALRFVGHEDRLREMYANLLARSMDKNTSTAAHPSFVEIIKQLTTDEARIISYLSEATTFPIISIVEEENKGIGVREIKENLSIIGYTAKCNDPKLIQSYISNLVRLGIIEIRHDQHYIDSKLYTEITDHEDIKTIIDSTLIRAGHKINIKKYLAKLTPLGIQFRQICVVLRKNIIIGCQNEDMDPGNIQRD